MKGHYYLVVCRISLLCASLINGGSCRPAKKGAVFLFLSCVTFQKLKCFLEKVTFQISLFVSAWHKYSLLRKFYILLIYVLFCSLLSFWISTVFFQLFLHLYTKSSPLLSSYISLLSERNAGLENEANVLWTLEQPRHVAFHKPLHFSDFDFLHQDGRTPVTPYALSIRNACDSWHILIKASRLLNSNQLICK